MNLSHTRELMKLLAHQRWACLATFDSSNSLPYAAFVGYALEENCRTVLLHISSLASHTQHLQQESRCCLAISQADDRRPDPQTLQRLSLQGYVKRIVPESEDFIAARTCYIERLPESAMRFNFSDFGLFRFYPEKINFVAGFGRAISVTAEQFAEIASDYADH